MPMTAEQRKVALDRVKRSPTWRALDLEREARNAAGRARALRLWREHNADAFVSKHKLGTNMEREKWYLTRSVDYLTRAQAVRSQPAPRLTTVERQARIDRVLGRDTVRQARIDRVLGRR